MHVLTVKIALQEIVIALNAVVLIDSKSLNLRLIRVIEVLRSAFHEVEILLCFVSGPVWHQIA